MKPTPHNAQTPQKMSAFEKAHENDPALIAYKKIYTGGVNPAGFMGFKRGYDASQQECDDLRNQFAKLENGERIILPKTKLHAKAMIAVARYFLKQHAVLAQSER